MKQRSARFLALGDSYTIGEGVRPTECWPAQLAVALRQQGIKIDEPTIIARTGWTTGELLAHIPATIDAAQLDGKFDLVTLQIGVNNQYRGDDILAYQAEFHTLLHQAIDFANGETSSVVVLSIPDWSVTPFAEGCDRECTAREIDSFNSVNREETARLGVRYVDVTLQSRLAADDPTLLAADGLHPSAEMYAAWTRLVLPVTLEVLGER